MHWSLGGPPPSGLDCTYAGASDPAYSVARPDAASQLLHIALQTDVTGYVAASWPRVRGHMAPADAVIGHLRTEDMQPSVRAYGISGMDADSVQPDAAVELTGIGLSTNATSLTICFTRNLTQVGSEARISISPSQEVVMNFVASRAPPKHVHLMSSKYRCSVALSLLREPGGPDDGGWRPGANVSDAGSSGADFEEQLAYMRSHGALQFTGWIVLVPAGILAARHRWLSARVGVSGTWFHLHRVIQGIATVLVVAGFILPWTSFNEEEEDEEHEDTLLEAHKFLAILLMVGLGLHVACAMLRPKPDHPRRHLWNGLHWWFGRGLALFAGVNVCIGIALWRRASGGTGAEWIVPLLLFGMGWMGLAAWLERRAPEGRGRETASSRPGTLTMGYVSSSVDSPGQVPMSVMGSSNGAHGVRYSKI